jgi:hypothetical protein
MTANAASISFTNWVSNDAAVGNYTVTVSEAGSGSFNFSVSSSNSEPLGFLVDLGNISVNVNQSNVQSANPSGAVTLFAVNTDSTNCGNGCNLNGLSIPLSDPNNKWEMVFSLGQPGSGQDGGVNSFSWTMTGLTNVVLSNFSLVGIRSQDLTGYPGFTSDKAYSNTTVPIPAAAYLFGSALLGMVGIGYRRNRKQA